MNEAPDLVEDSFVALIPISIRPCRVDDLPALEWCGAYREHREILARTFAAVEGGTQLMWVAELGGFPIGQIWVDLLQDRLGAARVFPALRGHGIGSRLVRAAERALSARGRSGSSVAVEIGNSAALRFWMREGYRPADVVDEAWSYVTPDGVRVERLSTLRLLEKDLREVAHAGNPLDHR
jgi:GNAT superfamily N-acetyltransferase